MKETYKHTQIGTLIIMIYLIALAFLGYLLFQTQPDGVALTLLLILLIVIVIFSTLTITINQHEFIFYFSLGAFTKKISLSEIQSYRLVHNPWIFGWGIHLTPTGWLYNVSGYDALEITLTNGKRLRIGTDDPQKLITALNMVKPQTVQD